MAFFILFLFAVVLFAGVLLVGAPYVPTLKKQAETALDMLELQSGDTLLELGCGDGKVLVMAAERGIRVVGYEVNPLLVIVARIRTLKYGQQSRVIWGNFWRRPWPRDADGIFVFLHPRFMKRLDKKIIANYPEGIRLASFAFAIEGRRPYRKKGGVFLYRYPM